MRQIRVGDRCEQIKHGEGDPPCTITTIEGNDVYHKHDGDEHEYNCTGLDCFELIEKSTKREFKVDDRVKLISDYGAFHDDNKGIATIKSISIDDNRKMATITFDTGYTNCFPFRFLELVESSSKKEFKEGDKVKVISESHLGWAEGIGHIGIIDYKDTSSYRVIFSEKLTNSGRDNFGYYLAENLELVELSTITKENNPEVENKMELDKMKAGNLKEAKKLAIEARTNAEIEYATQEYRGAVDQIDSFDRQIKSLEMQKKPYQETLAKFKGD